MDVRLTEISSGELIQAESAIIAGLLVLLTISAFYDKRVYSHFWGRPLLYLAFTPVLFFLSIGILLQGANQPEISLDYYRLGTDLFMWGLGFTIVAIPLAFLIMTKTLEK